MLSVIQTVNDDAMLTRFFSALVCAFFLAGQAFALELVMVEQKGCHYCEKWHDEIGPIYDKTDEGRFAPLRTVDIREGAPEGVSFVRPAVFTPTFVLIEDKVEIGRIEGYPGEDFFWGLLEMMLKAKTDFEKPAGDAASN